MRTSGPSTTPPSPGSASSYDVFDGGTLAAGNAGPTFAQLQNYRAVVFFTGNNLTSWANAHVNGSFPLQDYLVAGGKLVMTGQDLNTQYAYNQNVGSDFLYGQMAGWLTGREWTTFPGCGLTRSDRDFYGATAAANPVTAQLETTFTLLGKTGDVSTNLGGTGAGNQRFPDAGRTVTAADRYLCDEAYNGFEVEPHARVLGSYTTTKKDGVAASRLTNGVSTGVAADPTLENVEPLVTWNAALLHVGLEGLNPNRGQLSPQTALGLLHDFVSDSVSVAVTHKVTAGRVAFVAQASSARGAAITTYRWDFGDGSPDRRDDRPVRLPRLREGVARDVHRQRRGRERTDALRLGVGDRHDQAALAEIGAMRDPAQGSLIVAASRERLPRAARTRDWLPSPVRQA